MSGSVYILAPPETTSVHLRFPGPKALLVTQGNATELVLKPPSGCCASVIVAEGGAGKVVIAKGPGPQGPPGPAGAWAPAFLRVLTPDDILNGFFVIPDTPSPGSVFVFLNGLYQSEGVSEDFTRSGNVITWNPLYSLVAGEDFFAVRYQYNT